LTYLEYYTHMFYMYKIDNSAIPRNRIQHNTIQQTDIKCVIFD